MDNNRRHVLKSIFLWFFLGFTVYFLAGEWFLPATNFSENDFCQPFTAQWTQVKEDGERIDVTLPGKCQAKRDETVVVETVLPFDMDRGTLCFRSSRQDMKIYIDGKLRKEYSTEDSRFFGKSSAAAYIFVDLISLDRGKTLRVESRTDSSYSGIFQEIYFGTQMGFWKYQFQQNGAELISAVIMFFMALFSLIACAVLRFYYHRRVLLEDISLGVLAASIWIICNSRFRQLIFPEINVVSDAPFFMIMLLPLPFLIFVDGIQSQRYHRGFWLLEFLSICDFILFTVLHIANVADFADTVVYTSGMCLVAIFWIIFTLFLDIFHGKIGEYWMIAIGVAGTLLSGFAQVLLYFQRTKAFNGSFVAGGLVFLLAVTGINTVRDLLRARKERQEAIYASESKAQFLANVSHELRTPINAVLGLDEMILQEAGQEIVREYARDIQSAGRSLLALINDILDFSKIESGKMLITPGEYSVLSMLSDCYHMIFMRAGERGLELNIRNRGEIPSKLLGDEVRIRQILINLLTNAVKYTERGSVTVTVEGEKTGEEDFLLILTVEDTGIGIRRENMEKLFDSFQRLEETRNKNIEGTGLGLAITRQLVEIMGGRISVDSEYGRGSRFRVELPQRIIDAAPIGKISAQFMENYREKQEKIQSLRVSQGKILVVDDVSMNLKVFQGLLSKTGLEIHTGESGAECLRMAAQEKYHMIFLDHMMPGMNGVETLHALRNLPSGLNRETPVIMLTANAIVGAREEYLSQGFQDYLSKPVRKSDLEEMLLKYLPEDCLGASETPEETPEEPLEKSGAKRMSEKAFRERFFFLKVDTGLEYCGGSLEIYRGTLEAFLNSSQMEKLQRDYAERNWRDYQIQIHGLKGAALAIGAMELYQNAQILEQAVKEEDISYVSEHHVEVMRIYNELLLRVKLALE